LEPNKEEIKQRAQEIADWIYEDHPSFPSIISRLETLMEIYWYKGKQAHGV